ncbi:MAG: hypothetical protein Q9187_005536 [Circinaria calcarea]
MASTEVIVLSSSPATSFIATTPPRPHLLAPMVSSPGYLSPSQLLAKKQPYPAASSRDPAIPEGAFQGFATASSLLRRAYAVRQDEEMINQGQGKAESSNKKRHITERSSKEKISKDKTLNEQPLLEKPARERKARVSKVASDSAPKKPRAPRKKALPREPEAVETVGHEDCQAGTKVKPGQKPRVKGVDRPKSKIKKVKVNKLTSEDDPAKVYHSTHDLKAWQVPGIEIGELQGMQAKDGSVQEDPIKLRPDKLEEDEFENPKELGLQKVLTRRRDWTPVRDTLQDRLALQSPLTFKQPEIGTEGPPCHANETGFGDLISGYNCAQSAEVTVNGNASKRNWDGEAVTKRRKLDIIRNTICHLPTTAPAKRTKSLKKKPQTVTAKATESYVPDQSADSPSLLCYLVAPMDQQDGEIETPVRVAEKQPVKNTRKKPGVKPTRSSDTKNKKKTSRIPTILPPEQALAASNDQDLLFGTSSQLARDDSPTFVRELQQAIEASEAVAESMQLTAPKSLAESIISGSSNTSNVSLMTSSRNLWSVAARNMDGTLLDAEVIDLVDTPQARTVRKEDLGKVEKNNASLNNKITIENSAWTVLDENTIPCNNEALSHPPQPPIDIDGFTPFPLPRSVAEAALRPRTKSRSPAKRLAPSMTDQPPAEVVDQKPDFKGYTTAKLSKAITAYGFKPRSVGKARPGWLYSLCRRTQTYQDLNPMDFRARTHQLQQSEKDGHLKPKIHQQSLTVLENPRPSREGVQEKPLYLPPRPALQKSAQPPPSSLHLPNREAPPKPPTN